MTGWEFTSPLALLNEWRDREDGADLHEFLLLGSAVDLPFLERVAVPAARAMGARITVVGDAARGRYDPVDVRMAGRAYFHGLAACAGAFHPKVALLVGERDIVAAVGSGDPTMDGWGHDDELWTVLRGTREAVPAALAQLGEWLQMLPAGVAVPEYVDALLQEIAAPLEGARPAATRGCCTTWTRDCSGRCRAGPWTSCACTRRPSTRAGTRSPRSWRTSIRRGS
ncbi:hypothetical protein ACFQU9_01725 [Actinomadura namibiensis]|uniref:hypothetical protein n=1 Tax=Actinomadura kijaniata TaxID=46161 RepID=UPI00360EFCFF